MKTETLNTTTTATNTTTGPRYNWSGDPAALTWEQVQHMPLDEQGEALKAMGYADAGLATNEDIAYSVNYWLSLLMAGKVNRGNHLLYTARALFIFEQKDAEPKAQ